MTGCAGIAALLLLPVPGAGPGAAFDGMAGATPAPQEAPTEGGGSGVIYGRVTTVDGGVIEGWMRWGGDEEVLWGNFFNGRKAENTWASYVPPEQRPTMREAVGLFGLEFWSRDVSVPLDRPFMTRFGDIARIDASRREIRVTLKSGSAFVLDRFEADDLADGLHVWNDAGETIDLGEWSIRSVEFLPEPGPLAETEPLYGTVSTPAGDFTGLIQWNRQEALGADALLPETADEPAVRFAAVRTIVRTAPDRSRVTLRNGHEIEVTGRRANGGDRGVYIDDPRFGRVLIPQEAFERLEFVERGIAPGYDEFPAGGPLTGTVITRAGRELTGTVVFDLDESETTETLDAPSEGIHYTLPFGLVAAIVLPAADASGTASARVMLHGGEELALERVDDLGEMNAGLLVFAAGSDSAEYVPWAEVARIDFDRPARVVPGSGR